MGQARVKTLRYKLDVADWVIFQSPPPLVYKTDSFVLRLDNGELIVEMVGDFPSVSEARAVVDPFLRNWALYDALARHRPQIQFTYASAELVDPMGAPNVMVALSGAFAVAAVGTVTAQRSTYPAPPTSFLGTPLVRAFFEAHQSAITDRRMTAGAGYFVLTALKTRVRDPNWPEKGGRARSDRVANELAIEPAVLDKLHELTTDVGNLSTARKITDKAELDAPRRDHTGDELNWICEAILVVARRLGEWEANPHGLAPIRMSDLPKL
jgi:hypothetical protein